MPQKAVDLGCSLQQPWCAQLYRSGRLPGTDLQAWWRHRCPSPHRLCVKEDAAQSQILKERRKLAEAKITKKGNPNPKAAPKAGAASSS